MKVRELYILYIYMFREPQTSSGFTYSTVSPRQDILLLLLQRFSAITPPGEEAFP